MATVTDRGGKNRKGMGVSVYLTRTAEDLLGRVSLATRRSKSEIVSLLVETYGPELLAGREPGQKQ